MTQCIRKINQSVCVCVYFKSLSVVDTQGERIMYWRSGVIEGASCRHIPMYGHSTVALSIHRLWALGCFQFGSIANQMFSVNICVVIRCLYFS